MNTIPSPAEAENVKCADCGAVNAAARKWCHDCGKPLVNAIPLELPSGGSAPAASIPAGDAFSGLHTLGWSLLVLGFSGMVAGIFLPSTVTTETTYVLGRVVGGGEVHNFGLIARNLGLLIFGGFTALIGAVFIVAGSANEIRETLRRRTRRN